MMSTWAGSAQAGDALVVQETLVDPPTLIHLGVQVKISDDDDRDAVIDLRYREVGTADWSPGLSLFRVSPEKVTGLVVPQQFAGSLFGLRPDTEYEIELHAQDPDGFEDTWVVMGRTRPVPGDPQQPNMVAVTDTAGLASALAAATPGDVISLADGMYTGQFSISASGTADAPIVIRGASTEGTIVDGGNCDGCNVLEVYGSFIHLERLTLQAATRALRFQGMGSEGNVVRRVHVRDVRLGIGAREDQRNFYLCDNVLEGRLKWPAVYGDDGGMFANEDGIVVMGDGHVVCHNRLIGFGDSIKTEQLGTRALDIYGNLSLSAYDNGIELDATAGNVRAVGNMLLNSWSALSFQPIFGGPAYAIRNVAVNIVDEQQKLHGNGNLGETVGALIFHNTFISPRHAINLQASATAHDFRLINNLYVGPDALESGKVVDWSVPIDNGLLDGNGYYPDGFFDFGGADKWDGFALMQMAGKFEANGVLLLGETFESGLKAPASYIEAVPEVDVTLAAGSSAVDAALPLPGVNSVFAGGGPDIGARELGCAAPIYGVRPEGVDENSAPDGCEGGGETDSGAETGAETDSDSGATSDASGSDTATPTGGASDPGGTGWSPTGGDDGPDATTGTNTGSASGADTGDSTGATGGQDSEDGCGCRSDAAPGSPRLLSLGLVVMLVRRRCRATSCSTARR